MQLGPAEAIPASAEEGGSLIRVSVPPTRSDILHACDIVEDVAIAYGFNKLMPGRVPATSTVGGPLPLNHFSDQLRDEVARAGYTEVLTHGLCMTRENFDFLKRPNDGSAVSLANPANEEYEVVRTTLLPGILKTLNHNKSLPIKNGLKFYEISDVVLQDASAANTSDTGCVGARNERHLVAAYSGLTDGFEVIHGLVDRVLVLNQVLPAYAAKEGLASYRYEDCEDPAYFPGRRAQIIVQKDGKEVVLHSSIPSFLRLLVPAWLPSPRD